MLRLRFGNGNCPQRNGGPVGAARLLAYGEELLTAKDERFSEWDRAGKNKIPPPHATKRTTGVRP